MTLPPPPQAAANLGGSSPSSPSQTNYNDQHKPEEDIQEHGQGRFTESPTQLTAADTTSEGGSDEDADNDEEKAEEEESGEGGADGGSKEGESDEEESYGEDDEDEDESDEEEEEPALKYSRIEGSVPELLKKDSASAIAVGGNRLLALGTHAGIVHVMDLTGNRTKSYKPHLASIVDIEFDETGDFIGTASIDGQVHVRSLSSNEFYNFDLKRPMRTIALEPHFAARRGTRAFVCGGLAGNLVLYEKGWLGHRETILSSGEGPIWQVRWAGGLIAWANDLGVKIYHPSTRSLLTYIDRPPNSPRAELFKPTLHWQDDATLLIAWADYIKVVRVRPRPPVPAGLMSGTVGVSEAGAGANVSTAPYVVEVMSVFQMDGCAVAGIVPHPMASPPAETTNGAEYENHAAALAAVHDKKSLHSKAASTRTKGTVNTGGETVSEDSGEAGGTPGPGPVPISPKPTVTSAAAKRSKPLVTPPPLTTFLLLTYTPPVSLLSSDSGVDIDEELTEDRTRQARKASERPELRIVSRSTGEEIANDMLGVRDFEKWGCNEYGLALVPGDDDILGRGGVLPPPSKPNGGASGAKGADGGGRERCYVVMSPRDLVLVRKRDRRDRVQWLVERGRWEEALQEVEKLESELLELTGGRVTPVAASAAGTTEKEGAPAEAADADQDELTVQSIGQRYIQHLVDSGDFIKAASLTPKVCGRGRGQAVEKRWEGWIWEFAGRGQLQAIIPYVPTDAPRLDHVVYEMMLAHFMGHDLQTLLKTVKTWPREIYDIAAVIVAVKAQLERVEKSQQQIQAKQEAVVLLMECLAELYTANRQPGKALPYFLRLRRPNVFELIRENNLFTDVQDQVLLLVEFDHELMEKREKERQAAAAASSGEHKLEGNGKDTGKGWRESEAIRLLVDNIHSISINRVVQQLQERPHYLFLYLDALVEKDPHLVSGFADLQVKMYAEFATHRLIDFLRASNYYNLEKAYNVCTERDLVPEMVFLLGRMGNNKKALTLIIERLGDVQRAIEFAKSQNDDDLWEDLLKYSETRPTFIRGLLENVGVEISPIRLIRRIKNGLEIPGLKEALIKILQDFHLQIELLEGCRAILGVDCAELEEVLGRRQGGGFFLSAKSKCPICSLPLQDNIYGHPSQLASDSSQSSQIQQRSSLTLLFLCRHVVHASCASGGNHLPLPTDPVLRGIGYGGSSGRGGISGTIAFESMIRPRLRQGCPVCHAKMRTPLVISLGQSPSGIFLVEMGAH